MIKKTNVIAAVLWMVGTLLCFSVLAVSIRELSKVGFTIFEILAVRATGILTICGTLLVLRPQLRAHTRPQRMKLNLLRNVIHFVSQYAWATSLTMLPLATVFALEFTMPGWTALLAVWLLHERMTPSRMGVVVLGLFGALPYMQFVRMTYNGTVGDALQLISPVDASAPAGELQPVGRAERT